MITIKDKLIKFSQVLTLCQIMLNSVYNCYGYYSC